MQNISAKDFYEPCKYNFETRNQIWCSQIADSHDNYCDCKQPFAHLLASIFPPGHKDRDKTIDQILARDYTEKCLSSGEDAANHGLAGGGIKQEEETTEEKDTQKEEEDLDTLLAAAAAAAESTR